MERTATAPAARKNKNSKTARTPAAARKNSSTAAAAAVAASTAPAAPAAPVAPAVAEPVAPAAAVAAPAAPQSPRSKRGSKKTQARKRTQAAATTPQVDDVVAVQPSRAAAAVPTEEAASTPVSPAAQLPRTRMVHAPKARKKAAANHILVVAHPSAQAQQVFDLLKAAGVQEALPSRREQLSAQALTETLLKAHGLQWRDGQVPTDIESVEASPMWQSLVLDLVLGNMEQPLWAWLDPQAVHLLDFWQQQSAHTVFMLVYDDIENIYQQCLHSGADASPESINAKVQSWVAYNEALLQFHLRNPQRSFLVHAKQVAQSAQSYVQQINQRVAAPLELAAGHSTASEEPVDTAEQPTSQLASTELQTQPSTTTQPSTDGLANWLIEQLVHTQADALQLYEALQAAANLPLAQSAVTALVADGAALQQAWASFVAVQLQHSRNTQRVADLQQQLQTLQQQHAQVQALTDSEATAKQALQVQLKNAEEENALLFEQLHKVQEELERLYLQGKADVTKAKQLQEQLAAEQQAAKKLKEQAASEQSKAKKLQEQISAEQVKAKKLQEQLSAEQQTAKKHKEQLAAEQAKIKALQAQLAKAPSNPKMDASVAELKEENDLLLKQLHIVQEELERYFLENQKYKKNSPKKPEQKTYYGAAERVKQQLSYRLGSTMIANSRSISGWLSMPFALSAEVKKFRKDQEKKSNQKLPPISAYRDALEAERVKQHLSYRLGACMIKNSKSLSGWMSMPWKLSQEVKAFRKKQAD